MFSGAPTGEFRVDSIKALTGDTLPPAQFLRVAQERPKTETSFSLAGVVSNERYATQSEKQALVAVQEPIGRPTARVGALIPIKKSDSWWSLTQDERRAIFEERSAHVTIGMSALPQVARRLHHCRDLAEQEPFDFLTWFDFREEDTAKFDDLLGALRETEEWQYIEREVEIRVRRVSSLHQSQD